MKCPHLITQTFTFFVYDIQVPSDSSVRNVVLDYVVTELNTKLCVGYHIFRLLFWLRCITRLLLDPNDFCPFLNAN